MQSTDTNSDSGRGRSKAAAFPFQGRYRDTGIKITVMEGAVERILKKTHSEPMVARIRMVSRKKEQKKDDYR